MAYPPPDHYLSDLGARPVFDVEASRVKVEVTPALCAPGGGVLLGVLATVIDMAAGGLSRRQADPDWVATSDIAIDLAAAIPPGPCRIDCRLARRGRALVTLEIDLFAGGRRRRTSHWCRHRRVRGATQPRARPGEWRAWRRAGVDLPGRGAESGSGC